MRPEGDQIDQLAEQMWYWITIKFQKATFSDIAVIVTNLIVIVVGIIALSVYMRQLSAMRGQLSIMQQQLDTTDRPWIKILGATASEPVVFRRDAGGNDFVNAGIKVYIQNVGHSVALDVSIRDELIFVSLENRAPNNVFDYPVQMQKKFCSESSAGELPINLFPGDDNMNQTGDDHDALITGKTFTPPNDSLGPRIMPMLVGCVDYKIAASGKTHQSGFIYQLKEVIPGQEMNRGMLIVGKNIPLADIRMEQLGFDGFFAN